MRKKFLIKPHVQIRHLARTLAVVLVSCILGYVLFEGMVGSMLERGGFPGLDWVSARHLLRVGFGLTLVILILAIGLENYLLFHRFIGPIFALEKGLKRMSEGELGDVTTIRDSDELKDLIGAFEDMKKEVRRRLSAQEKTSHLLAAELDRLLANTSAENIKDVKARIKAIRDQVEKMAA